MEKLIFKQKKEFVLIFAAAAAAVATLIFVCVDSYYTANHRYKTLAIVANLY